MRKLLFAVLTLLLSIPLMGDPPTTQAHSILIQHQETPRVLVVPGQRRRRIRGDRRMGRHSIRRAFAKAGRSAGRGGKRFGQNIARGRPARGGKELGKGTGGFGKHTGRGVARTMRRLFKP